MDATNYAAFSQDQFGEVWYIHMIHEYVTKSRGGGKSGGGGRSWMIDD